MHYLIKTPPLSWYLCYMRIFIIMILFYAAMLSAMSCNSNNNATSTDAATLEQTMRRAQAKYNCPMLECKNGYSNTAGSCPDCKMDLALNKNFVEVK